jgi:ribosomal protein L11 methylase PrmA
VYCLHADLSTLKLKEKFSVVAANMFESEHARFLKTISGAVSGKKNGYLLIAGTLRKQYPRILRMYKKKGFVEIRSVKKKEWQSGMMQKLTNGKRC